MKSMREFMVKQLLLKIDYVVSVRDVLLRPKLGGLELGIVDSSLVS